MVSGFTASALGSVMVMMPFSNANVALSHTTAQPIWFIVHASDVYDFEFWWDRNERAWQRTGHR